MAVTFGHVNLVAADWERLSLFYQEVFECVPVPPRRDQQGPWLDAGTGLRQAHLRGEHLRLPGLAGDDGPTLEIYSYDQALARPEPAPNRIGLGHLAFQVADVPAHLEKVVATRAGPSAKWCRCRFQARARSPSSMPPIRKATSSSCRPGPTEWP